MIKKHVKSNFVSIVLTMVLMVFTALPASAATLDLTRVKQAKTNWCWAATSEMIGKYMNSSSTRTQWDIVKHIKGSSYPNEGGSVSNIKTAIKYASVDTVTYKSGTTRSWSVHKSNIDSGNPIAVWMSWDNNGGAHAVVCAGTKTSSGTNYLYIVDPWEDNTSEWYNYTSLKNGTSIQSGKGKYVTSFWKS